MHFWNARFAYCDSCSGKECWTRCHLETIMLHLYKSNYFKSRMLGSQTLKLAPPEDLGWLQQWSWLTFPSTADSLKAGIAAIWQAFLSHPDLLRNAELHSGSLCFWSANYYLKFYIREIKKDKGCGVQDPCREWKNSTFVGPDLSCLVV